MQKVSLVEVQHEVEELRKSVAAIQKAIAKIPKQSIIIERIDESMLTTKQRRAWKEAMSDLKKGRKSNFLTVSQLKAGL